MAGFVTPRTPGAPGQLPPPVIPPRGSTAARYTYEVVRQYPHDPGAFTQGLEFVDGVLYEGTGLEGHSSLRKVDLGTGRVLQRVALPPELFGEGIAVVNSRILQLTWRSGVGFIYDRTALRQIGTFHYAGEGWGLTHSGRELVMSDGTAELRFLDPTTLAERRRLPVSDAGVAINALNELEWVDGEIFANVWQTDWIARISPMSGRVVGWIDLTGLLPIAARAGADVLNGIAYDERDKRLFVTGKLWPRLFEIRLKPVARNAGTGKRRP